MKVNVKNIITSDNIIEVINGYGYGFGCGDGAGDHWNYGCGNGNGASYDNEFGYSCGNGNGDGDGSGNSNGHGYGAQYDYRYQAAHLTGGGGIFGKAGSPGRPFPFGDASPQHNMKDDADANAEDGHGDERTAPAPDNSDAGGDKRRQEVAEAAADQMKAQGLAARSRLRYRG